MGRLDPALSTDFRHVLGHFATGLSVLTAQGPVGMTVQALMSLSLDPPLIALGIGRRSRVWAQVRRTGAFRVNLLSAEQEALAWRFGARTPPAQGSATAGSADDRFAGVSWRAGPRGLPELTDAHAWIDCDVRDEHDGGDHWLVVAHVRGLRVGSGEPLIFHRGRTGRLARP